MNPIKPFNKSSLKLGASLFSCLALSTSASAQLAPTKLAFDQNAYEAGEAIALTLEADPFDVPLMIMGAAQGPTVVSGLGTFGVAVGPKTKIFKLPRLKASGKAVYNCDVECDSGLRETPIYMEVLTFNPVAGSFTGLSNTVAFQQVDGDCGSCAEEAQIDSTAKYGGGHALYLPGIGNDFVFAPGGSLIERSDGTARFSGVVSRSSDPSKAFAVEVLMTGRIDPLSAAFPPAGSPKLELLSSAYLDNGGSIDPRDWRYYDTLTGFLTGLDDLEGALVQVDRRGPAFQVGFGANGKNVSWGGSGWLDYDTLAQPVNSSALPNAGTGDININAHGDCVECTDAAKNHALWLPGFGKKYKFISGGDFEELADGTAHIAGIVENKNEASNQWSVDIQFGDRVNPGAAVFPPLGSPKKELSSGSYLVNGGIVDPNTWHFYEDVQGTMTGLLDNQGDTIVLTRRGPALQVGVGANGKNENYGASVWFNIDFYPGGSQTPIQSKGDMNIDIGGDCETNL